MEIFHHKPALRKLARVIVWIIPAFTLPFFVVAIMATGHFWPVVAIVYSAFVVGLGYCDTHLPESGDAPIRHASPGTRLQFAMGFYGLQIFVAPIILILIAGMIGLGMTLVSRVFGF